MFPCRRSELPSGPALSDTSPGERRRVHGPHQPLVLRCRAAREGDTAARIAVRQAAARVGERLGAPPRRCGRTSRRPGTDARCPPWPGSPARTTCGRGPPGRSRPIGSVRPPRSCPELKAIEVSVCGPLGATSRTACSSAVGCHRLHGTVAGLLRLGGSPRKKSSPYGARIRSSYSSWRVRPAPAFRPARAGPPPDGPPPSWTRRRRTASRRRCPDRPRDRRPVARGRTRSTGPHSPVVRWRRRSRTRRAPPRNLRRRGRGSPVSSVLLGACSASSRWPGDLLSCCPGGLRTLSTRPAQPAKTPPSDGRGRGAPCRTGRHADR
jgi:hypothetical protein